MGVKLTRQILLIALVYYFAITISRICTIPIRIALTLYEVSGVFLIVIATAVCVWGFVSLHYAWAILITIPCVLIIYLCHTTHKDSESISDDYTLRMADHIANKLLQRIGHSMIARPRLHLRPVLDMDLPVFFDHLQHHPAQQMAAFIHEHPEDRAAHDAHWNKLLANDSITKRSIELVHPNADPELVGHIISFTMEGDREITYWIDHRHWGKGIASEALRQFLAIEHTRPLYGRAAKDNEPSIRVMEHNGFKLLRYERGYAHARGAEIDEVVMILHA